MSQSSSAKPFEAKSAYPFSYDERKNNIISVTYCNEETDNPVIIEEIIDTSTHMVLEQNTFSTQFPTQIFCKKYHPNGMLRIKGNRNGRDLFIGYCEAFHDNGQMSESATLNSFGEIIDEHKSFDKDGNLVRHNVFDAMGNFQQSIDITSDRIAEAKENSNDYTTISSLTTENAKQAHYDHVTHILSLVQAAKPNTKQKPSL